MSGTSLVDGGVEPFPDTDLGEAWADVLRRTPLVLQYVVAPLLVGLASAFGFALERLIPAANLTLIFVLPVVIAATTFGWGPALVSVVAGVLCFDYFFTEPYYQLTIASPTDLWAAVLLFVVAAMVSAVATAARRRAVTAQRAARQARALQSSLTWLSRGGPSARSSKRRLRRWGRSSERPPRSSANRTTASNCWPAASGRHSPMQTKMPRSGLSPCNFQCGPGRIRSRILRFDFWPLPTLVGTLVLGVDFTRAEDARPPAPERFVEVVGAIWPPRPAALRVN